jgi:hypothetical protein
MARRGRTTAATSDSARVRLRSAQAYLEVADLVLDEKDRVEMPGVAAGLAVLAGIAGSDAICARRLGAIHRAEDHRGAAALLEEATPDGKKFGEHVPPPHRHQGRGPLRPPPGRAPEGSGRGPLGKAVGRPCRRGARTLALDRAIAARHGHHPQQPGA